jgi:signal transduction histidine kinase/DNA-binding response OmpR family regulator/streptogramin lyase
LQSSDDGRSNGFVDAIAEDKNGKIWAIVRNQGMFYYQIQTDSFAQYTTTLPFSRPVELISDSSKLWILTIDSIYTLQSERASLINYSAQFPFPAEKEGLLKAIFKDSQDRLWIGTSQGQIWYIDFADSTYKNVPLSYTLDKKTSNVSIYDFLEDGEGNIWVASSQGIYQLVEEKVEIKQVQSPQPYVRQTSTFEESPLGDLWVTLRGNGCLEQYTSSIENEPIQVFCTAYDKQGNAISLKGTNGLAFCTENQFWCSNGQQGLLLLEIKNDSLFVKEHLNIQTLGGYALGIAKGVDNHFWVEMMGKVAHLHKKDSWQVSFPIPDSILEQMPRSATFFDVLSHSSGDVYAATNTHGIFRFSSTGEFDTLLSYDVSDPTSFPNPGALSMTEDSMGRIWFVQAGIFVYDPQVDTTAYYGREIGMPVIFNLTASIDQKQRLWVSTSQGLMAIDLKTMSVRKFPRDMIPISCGNCRGSLSDGRMLLGVMGGFVHFHPDSLWPRSHQPAVVITDFQLSGESVLELGSIQKTKTPVRLQKSLLMPQQIKLPYDETDISITFSALHFQEPESNLFKYKLEGYDKAWRTVDFRNRKATYTNLPPKTYTFRVQASNHVGDWNEEGASLVFTIPPPPWLSSWAKAAYLLLSLFLIWLAYRIIRDRIQLRRSLWEEQEAKKRNEEIREMQSRLYTNVSHEFRTPLTLIKSPLEELKREEEDAEKQKHLSLAYDNTRQLQSLIDQLMDIASLEANQLPVRLEQRDVYRHLHIIGASFSSFAENKKISYQIEIPDLPFWATYDSDKLEKICNNLVGNAMKFTPGGGKISFQGKVVEENGQLVLTLSVSDTGPGIASSDQKHIFDRFYQADAGINKKYEGTGIGLALTQELIQLLDGNISLESTEGKGTTFDVKIPIIPTESNPLAQQPAEAVVEGEKRPLSEISPLEAAIQGQKRTILLVEDHERMNQYIKDLLASQFHVITAFNGKEGLQLAEQYFPDAVISDVMMPIMDGYRFTHQLKENGLTSHIPVMLLTAKSDSKSKIEGFQQGADQYLEKPFESAELIARVQAMLEQRQRLRAHYQSGKTFIPKDLAPSERDLEFIKKLKSMLEENYHKGDFNLKKLNELMDLGHRMALQRKVKALFGASPGQFIRDFRMRKAAELLSQSDYRIGEIAFKVGYENPSGFSKAFKDTYDCTPNDYREEQRDDL